MNVMPESAARRSPGTPPIVLLKGIAKYFPGVIANQDVDLEVWAGEIHALLGENGAGKSTLMNVLTGIYNPDAGEIIIDGYARDFASPVEAIAAGIGMVHQHFKLVKAFTVAENIHLGWSETPARISAAALEARTAELAAALNLAVKPGARVEDLSTGEQQRVEILRVLTRQARVLILDEPTAVLTPAEARELFRALRDFVARGNAVIFISHKLDEVLEISDRISVLRGGRKVATEETRNCNQKMLAKLMVGHEIVLNDLRGRSEGAAPVSPDPVMSLHDVSAYDDLGNIALNRVSLDIHAGEILGIAGVAGNGQKELSQVLTGMRAAASGSIVVGGKEFSGAGAGEFADFGVGHIPEDRRGAGLVLNFSIAENTILGRQRQLLFSWRGLVLRLGAIVGWARRLITQFDVRAPSEETHVRALSGGNQQKVIVARELASGPRVLLASQPTRGVDIGAIEFIHRRLVAQRDEGAAILLVSAELDEIRSLSDRIAVMYEGKIVSIESPDVPDERLGLLMTGGSGRQTQHTATA